MSSQKHDESGTPHQSSSRKSRLRRALETLTRAAGPSPDQRELAAELLAELTAAQDASPDPYFAHNLAVLVSGLADRPETEDLAASLGPV